MYSPNRAIDELIYATRRLVGTVDWLAETGSDHGHADECCNAQYDALSVSSIDMPRLLAPFTHYSDGRPMLSTVSIDNDGLRVTQLWPPDPADHPTEPFDSPRYPLAAEHSPGDRGWAIFTWHPDTFTATVRYIEPLAVVRPLRAV